MRDAIRESPGLTHKVSDVGRYRLIAELARGGMGIVFLALVRGPGGFNKLFCIKVLKGQMAEDRKLVSMFLEEARLAAKLNHPNVVQTIEVGSDAGQHFIAMEYLEGQSYNEIQARGRRGGPPFPLSYQLHVLVHLLEGLQYAHAAADFDGTSLHLVHRDVSPHNVFITYEGQVKVLDFGIAKALGSSNDTNTGMLKGKIAYMAPEQAAGERLDGRADVFSVGVMLWEAAVGRRMWHRGLNDLQILHALMKGNVPDPREEDPDLDPRLARIILQATAVNAADRYSSASEMQGELEAYLRDLGPPSFGARDIGKFVSEVFAEDRTHIKAVIEEQLRLLHGTSSGQYATIDLPLLSTTTAASGTPSGVLLSEQPERPTLVEGLRSSSGVRVPLGASGGTRSRRSPVGMIAVAVGVAVLGAGALALSLRRPADPPPQPVPSAVSASTAAATAATAATASTSIVASVASESPRAVLDAGSPAAREDVAAATAARTPFPLHPVPHAQPAAGAVSTAVPSPSAPAPQPTTTSHVRQQIDTSNPYGH